MRSKIILILLVSFCVNYEILAQNVYIPDPQFKANLVGSPLINTNNDTEIQLSEAASYTGTIDVTSLGINDLTGIEAFTNTTALLCPLNNISTLDLTSNTGLLYLECSYNPLTNLYVGNLSNLETIHCSGIHLTVLNVSSNPGLEELICSHNPLGSLDLSGNPALKTLVCINNQLSALDLSSNPSLRHLECSNNTLTALDLSLNPNLEMLTCEHNYLTQLDLSANVNLHGIQLSYNQISTIDLSSLPYLMNFDAEFNPLTSLDLSNNPMLKWLNCGYDQLTGLNIKNGNNINLDQFESRNNPALTCIQVDDAVMMNNNWANNKDASSTFSENCAFTSVSEHTTALECRIFPNPCKGVFRLDVKSSSVWQVSLYDAIGRLLIAESYRPGIITLDISDRPKGIYFVNIFTEDNILSGKILKD